MATKKKKKIVHAKKWTEEELKFLEEHVNSMSDQDIAEALGRSRGSICSMKHRLLHDELTVNEDELYYIPLSREQMMKLQNKAGLTLNDLMKLSGMDKGTISKILTKYKGSIAYKMLLSIILEDFAY